MKYNRRIIVVMVVICALFLSLALYLTYFTLFKAESVTQSSYNRRIWEEENSVLRGSIRDRNGIILAYSERNDDSQTRIYPFGGRYAHTIGYNSRTYGKSGLEQRFNDVLVSNDALQSISGAIYGTETEKKGANLRLTLDNALSESAEKLMKGKNGAVVALVPKTGEILCLYSNPTFDPNEDSLVKNWQDLAESEDSPFLARATGGLYPPGSTFKIVTSAAAVEAGYENYSMNDTGSCKIDGYVVKNSGGHAYGQIDLKAGFAKSSNVMFATLASILGEDAIRRTARSFGIGEEFNFDIKYSKSRFGYDGGMKETEVAAVGIGQGKLLVTPLNMALVTAGIANDGVIMQPYLVEDASYDSGRSVYKAKRSVWRSAASGNTAQKVGEFMEECVKVGTGKGAQISSVTVAGKTGTAQNEREGKEHAWFVCYAPAENPEIAICVMQEYSGVAGSSCAPVAKALIRQYLGK